MPKVALIGGRNRRDSIRRSLELISKDIKSALNSRQIVIKPNLVSTSIQLASTHIDQLRGILDFLTGFYKDRIVIAEAAAGNTEEGFHNFGYYSLLDEYPVELVDLNKGSFESLSILDSRGRKINIRVSSMLLDRNNFIISAAKLKTHDTVVVTLSIKNLVMGSIYLKDKVLMHQGYRQINLNIAELAHRLRPELAVIDGIVGMEGDGPIYGTPVDVGVVISSTDPLAADRVACEIMGVDFKKVGYLSYCAAYALGRAELEEIEIIGEPLEKFIRPFRLHSSVNEQYQWY
jgi:uncharacterized protein (DUF362 family)